MEFILIITTLIFLNVTSLGLLYIKKQENIILTDMNIELQKDITNLKKIRHAEKIQYLDDMIKSEEDKRFFINRSVIHINIIENIQNLDKRLN